MDAKAKQELANAIIDTINCHEQSWVNEDRPRLGRYQRPREECAAEAVEDEELRPLVVAMLQAGYVEFPDWAQEQLNRRAPPKLVTIGGTVVEAVEVTAEMLKRLERKHDH
jgi:hypothetical protein